MSGGVNPAEWIFPVVGASHVLYNAVAQQADPAVKLETPGSANVRRDQAAARQREQTDALRGQAEEADRLRPRPHTAAQDFDSRARRSAAQELLGGAGRRRRAAQTLTSSDRLLGGGLAEGV